MTPSRLLETLLCDLPPNPIPVRSVCIGVHWTIVLSQSAGMAATMTRHEAPHGSVRVRDVGSLHRKSAQELAAWLESDNPLEASVGLAALNSLLTTSELPFEDINAADVLKARGAGKNVAIIGHFPFVEALRTVTSHLWVLELHPAPGDLPAQVAPEVLPKADVVAITATTLINHTLEELLALCSPSAWVMLLGPSTPLTPRLFDFGIDMLSGVQVIDEASALLTIQQGAVFPQVRGVRVVALSRENVNRRSKVSSIKSGS